MPRNTLQEYVIALGAQIDNQGVTKALALLDSAKLKALGVAGALGAATTAVYKFIESASKREFELERLAKQQSKTVALTRAENSAMKAMGKTMDEINKDKKLKEIHKDIVEFNKGIAFPNMTQSLDKLRNLEGAFWKLKDTLGYTIQWVNAQVLANLEAPMDRMTGKLGKITTWLRDNMGRVSSKIGLVISDFGKGIVGIGEGIGKVFEIVQKLPDGIKAVGLALGGVMVFLKGGTIGRLLMAITAVGDFMHDYDNWKANQALDANDPNRIETAWDPLWEILDNSGLSGAEKASKIAELLLGNGTNLLDGLFTNVNMEEIFFGEGEGKKGLFPSIIDFVESHEAEIQKFGTSLVTAISRGLSFTGGVLGGTAGLALDGLFGSGTADKRILTGDGGAGTGLFGGLFGFGEAFANEIKKEDGNFFKGIKEGLKGFAFGSIISTILANFEKDPETGGFSINWGDIGEDLKAVGHTILSLITAGLGELGDLGGEVLKIVGGFLADSDLGVEPINDFVNSLGITFQKWGTNDTLRTGITGAVTTLFAGGNLFEAAITGALGSFTAAREKAMKDALLRSHGKYKNGENGGLKGFIGGEWAEMTSAQIEEAFNGLPEKDKEVLWSNTFGNLGGALGEFITGIWDTILDAAKMSSELGSTLFTKLFEAIGSLLGIGAEQFVGMEDNVILGGLAVGTGVKMAGGSFLLSLFAGLTAGITEAQDQALKEGSDLWTVLKRSCNELWEKIQILWYGAIDENGNRVENTGLQSIFQKLFEGGDGNKSLLDQILEWLAPVTDPIVSFFKNLWDQIYNDAIVPIGDAFIRFFQSLWVDIYNAMPGGLKSILGLFGVKMENPNTSTIEENEKGEKLLVDTQGRSVKLSDMQYEALTNGMEAYQYGTLGEDGKRVYNLAIDENGNIIGTGKHTESGALNGFTGKRLSDEHLASKEHSEREKEEKEWDKEYLSQPDYYNAEIPPDQPGESWEYYTNKYGRRYKRKVGSDGSTEKWYTLDEHGWLERDKISDFDEDVEDGYLFKELGQLINNAGLEAIRNVKNNFGVGFGTSLGLFGNGSVPAGRFSGMTNISAPINIYVNATGADGKEIGAGAYDAAERHLTKTLRGVFG